MKELLIVAAFLVGLGTGMQAGHAPDRQSPGRVPSSTPSTTVTATATVGVAAPCGEAPSLAPIVTALAPTGTPTPEHAAPTRLAATATPFPFATAPPPTVILLGSPTP